MTNSPINEVQRQQPATGAHGFAHLFVADDELRRRLNPKIGRDRFRAVVKVAELAGFPRINKLWGGRYWPAVKAWLDNDNGVGDRTFIGNAEDGPEDFSAAPRRR